LDLHWRKHHGEEPHPADYRPRFPQNGALIEAVFNEADRRSPRSPNHPGGIQPGIVDVGKNLLLGLLPFQNNFIDRARLLYAFNIGTADKSRHLGRILVARGALTESRQEVLKNMVREHLEAHEDVEKSLAALESIGSLRDDLAGLGDAELSLSLAKVSRADTV